MQRIDKQFVAILSVVMVVMVKINFFCFGARDGQEKQCSRQYAQFYRQNFGTQTPIFISLIVCNKTNEQ